jgi:Stress responsive A/B Barrel Domain
MIRHIVTWKLKAEDAADKDAAFASMAEVFGPLPQQIPAIKALHLGRDLGETTGNWDVVLITDHDSAESLQEYQDHPAHQPVKAIVGSLTGERAALDFEL